MKVYSLLYFVYVLHVRSIYMSFHYEKNNFRKTVRQVLYGLKKVDWRVVQIAKPN